jgi:SET domain-containing protein
MEVYIPQLKVNKGKEGSFKKKLIYSNKIKCGLTEYGYGVYCIRSIRKGEVIEECVVATDRISSSTDVMDNYRFLGTDDAVIVLGNAMLYNHSSQPNIHIQQHKDYERLLYVYALRDVKKGEELKWHYGYQP